MHSPAQGDQDVPDDEDNGEEEENDIEQEVLVPGKAKIVHHSMQEQFQMFFFKKNLTKPSRALEIACGFYPGGG